MDDLLEVAIKMERNGETVYRNAAQTLKQKNLVELLTWMAAEETSHGLWFLDQKKRLILNPEEKQLKEMIPEALQNMMGDNTLSLSDVAFDRISTPADLLKAFMEFEQDSIRFYEILSIFIEEKEVRDGLEKIIQEEKNHVKKLADLFQGITQSESS